MKRNIITVFLLICLLPMLVLAQSGTYKLHIKFKNLDPKATAYLIESYGSPSSRMIDTLHQKKGTFQFQNQLEEPTKVSLVINHEGTNTIPFANNKADQFDFFLEPGIIKITGLDSARHATIKAGTVNKEFVLYNEKVTVLSEDLNTAFKKMRKDIPAAERTSVESRKKQGEVINVFIQKIDSLNRDFVHHNPDSYLSLHFVKNIDIRAFDDSKNADLFKKLSPALQKLPSALPIANYLAETSAFAIGQIAPDFVQNDVNGQPVRLSDFKGKYVLLDFWASWCIPCRKENPHVIAAYKNYQAKNFTVLGVSLDGASQKTAWLEAIEKDGLPWTNVSDLKGRKNEVALLYKITAIPKNFLIDPNGKIVAKNLKGEALETYLSKILK